MDMAAIFIQWHLPFVFSFITPSRGGSTWNLASIGLAVSKEKQFENVESEWPWPLIFIKLHLLFWYTASTNLDIIDYNNFWKKSIVLPFSLTKA